MRNKIIVAKISDNHYMLTRACSGCYSIFNIKVKHEDYRNWNAGQFIQYAFPYLSISERELLVSGVCGACFDKMFNSVENCLGEED